MRRQIKDEHGTAWDIWDVKPADAVSSAGYDRRNPARANDGDAVIGSSDDAAIAPMLSAELKQGWLCFQSGDVRRRFAPIPPKWADLPDGVLRVMLDVANPVAPAAGSDPVALAPPTSDAD